MHKFELEEFQNVAHVSQTIKNLFYEFATTDEEFRNEQESLDEITDMFCQDLAEFIVNARYTDSQVYNLKMLLETYSTILDHHYADVLK